MTDMQYLTRAEAAEYVRSKGLPCTKGTLQKLATTGGGPAYQRFGNQAVYTERNLDAWIESKLCALRRSTSEIQASA